MEKTARRIAAAASGLAVAGIAVVFGITSCLAGERQSFPVVKSAAGSGAESPCGSGTTSTPLRVMTVNIAHGRKDGPNQLLQGSGSIRANLDELAALLRREKPDVVALQEADGPSFWSGNFDHVDYLADKAGLAFSMRGEHVRSRILSYGTAIMSALELGDPLSFTFAPSPPTFSKGFVVSTIEWPPSSDRKIDLVSVHLDFSRSSVRRKQAEELAAALQSRKRQRIVMGDFNCTRSDANTAIGILIDRLFLKPYRPEADDLVTFPKLGKRFDWILLSPELEFAGHAVVPDTVSDHRAVLAEIRWIQGKEDSGTGR